MAGLALADWKSSFPDYPHAEERPVTLYVRPHELEIQRRTQWRRRHARPGRTRESRPGPSPRLHCRPKTMDWD